MQHEPASAWGSMMSIKQSRVPRSASSEMIRKAMKNFEQMPKERRIDLMAEASLLTPEQAVRAKKKWAEIQAAAGSTERGISGVTKPKRPRAYIPSTALAKSIEFDDAMMRVAFTDGRVLGVPLAWFPTLLAATPEQRARCEIGGGGVGLHWPDLDEDLSVAGLMAGVDWSSA